MGCAWGFSQAHGPEPGEHFWQLCSYCFFTWQTDLRQLFLFSGFCCYSFMPFLPLHDNLGISMYIINIQVSGSILPSSVISLYCMYLCYSGMASEPRDYECNGLHKHSKAVSTSSLALGLLTTVLSVVYSAVRAGSSTTLLSPPSSPRAGQFFPFFFLCFLLGFKCNFLWRKLSHNKCLFFLLDDYLA